MTKPRNVLIPYVVDVVGPFVAYAVVHWLGAPAFWALTAGGLVAGTSTAINTVRRRGLDSVGMLVLLEILVSLVLLVVVHDERLMLIRPSFYTLVAARVSALHGGRRQAVDVRGGATDRHQRGSLAERVV